MKFSLIFDFLITSSKVLAFLILLLGLVMSIHFNTPQVFIEAMKYSCIAISVKNVGGIVTQAMRFRNKIKNKSETK